MKREIYRVIDANLNRAREGLRVIEDSVRFLFNDRKWYKRLRNFRHKIDDVCFRLYPKLLCSRNTKLDVGKDVTDKKIKNTSELIIINIKRVQEALRVLEEYSRLISSDAGYMFKKLRFKLYELEGKIHDEFKKG